MASSAGTSSTIGVAEPIISQIFTSTLILGVGVLLPLVVNTPTNHWVTQVIIGESWPPYVPSFMLPLGIIDCLYGMLTTMMTGLQSHVAKIASPLNQHLVSGSVTNIPGRVV